MPVASSHPPPRHPPSYHPPPYHPPPRHPLMASSVMLMAVLVASGTSHLAKERLYCVLTITWPSLINQSNKQTIATIWPRHTHSECIKLVAVLLVLLMCDQQAGFVYSCASVRHRQLDRCVSIDMHHTYTQRLKKTNQTLRLSHHVSRDPVNPIVPT